MQKLQRDLEGLYGDEALALQAFNRPKGIRATSDLRGFTYEEVSADFTFHYSDSEIAEENAVIVMTEDNKEKSSINGESVISLEQIKHQFILEKRDGRWLIVGDLFLNGQQPEISDGKAVPPIKGEIDDSQVENMAPAGNPMMYNRSRAVSYARQWAYSHNWRYRRQPLDCTNFISQCLKAGNWFYVGWGHPGSRANLNQWWYTWFTQTYTWVNANDWSIFTLRRPRGVRIPFARNLKLGDIVQIDYTRNGVMNHSLIVTKKVGNEVYVSAHTQARLDKKLADIERSYSSATFHYVSIFDAFY